MKNPFQKKTEIPFVSPETEPITPDIPTHDVSIPTTITPLSPHNSSSPDSSIIPRILRELPFGRARPSTVSSKVSSSLPISTPPKSFELALVPGSRNKTFRITTRLDQNTSRHLFSTLMRDSFAKKVEKNPRNILVVGSPILPIQDSNPPNILTSTTPVLSEPDRILPEIDPELLIEDYSNLE